MNWIGLNLTELNWTELNWIELNWTESVQVIVLQGYWIFYCEMNLAKSYKEVNP